ncbi:MAG: hypothetical protein IMZ53_08075 [Thermoplasmata archaeon]|nr:hypothetical protein [Thermoplasmata archaeon]MBE3140524.1 hypothetical protein [Thermoplasmata archaeon]
MRKRIYHATKVIAHLICPAGFPIKKPVLSSGTLNHFAMKRYGSSIYNVSPFPSTIETPKVIAFDETKVK